MFIKIAKCFDNEINENKSMLIEIAQNFVNEITNVIIENFDKQIANITVANFDKKIN